MSVGTIILWGALIGLAAWVLLSMFALATRICGWAMEVIEDMERGTHRNIFERKFMEMLGFSWNVKRKQWCYKEDETPSEWYHNLVPKERESTYRCSYYHAYYLPTALWWSFLSMILIFATGLGIVIWKITLPILIFFLGVYLLRSMRRKAKAASAKAPEKSETEKELEQRYPEKK